MSFTKALDNYPTLNFFLEITGYSVIIILLFSLNFWFVTLAPIIFFPIAIGIVSVIFFSDRKKALLVAGISGSVGALINYNFMKVTNLIDLLNAMPRNFNKDIIPVVYKIIVFTIKDNDLLNNSSVTLTIIVSAVVAVLSVIVAYVLFYGLRKNRLKRDILIYVFLILVLTNITFTLIKGSAGLRINVSEPPIDENYSYDGTDYLRVFYEMRHGQNFYQAYVKAFTADTRFSDNDLWIYNPKLVRQPWLFYFWKLIAKNGSRLVYMSIILSILATGIITFSINNSYGSSAAAISILLLMPYLFMANVWTNVFLPDWWAALLILLAVAALLAKKYGISALLAFLAGACRELMIFFTLSATIASLLKRKYKEAMYYGISSIMIIFVYIFHIYLGGEYLPLNRIPTEHRFSLGFNLSSLTNTAGYLMFPYGYFKIPAVIILILAVVAGMRMRDKLAGRSLALFFLFFIFFTLFINSSTYWGQMFMPVALGMLPMLFFTGRRKTVD